MPGVLPRGDSPQRGARVPFRFSARPGEHAERIALPVAESRTPRWGLPARRVARVGQRAWRVPGDLAPWQRWAYPGRLIHRYASTIGFDVRVVGQGPSPRMPGLHQTVILRPFERR